MEDGYPLCEGERLTILRIGFRSLPPWALTTWILAERGRVVETNTLPRPVRALNPTITQFARGRSRRSFDSRVGREHGLPWHFITALHCTAEVNVQHDNYADERATFLICCDTASERARKNLGLQTCESSH